MRWLRLWTDIISDPKVRMLAFEDRWHFVALLCMKRRGELDGVTGDLLERTVGVTLGVGDRDRDEVKRRLMEVTLIDESWQPKAWDRRQFPSDSSTQRVKAFRERSGNVSETLQKRSGNVLEQRESREEEEAPQAAVTPPKRSRARKPQTTIPAGFELDAALREYAESKLPQVDAAALFESFCGKARAKSWVYADWRQAWQEFCRNASPNSGHWSSGQFPKRAATEKQLTPEALREKSGWT